MDPRYLNCPPFSPASTHPSSVQDFDYCHKDCELTYDQFSEKEWVIKRQGKPRPGTLIWDIYGKNIYHHNYKRETKYPIYHQFPFLEEPNCSSSFEKTPFSSYDASYMSLNSHSDGKVSASVLPSKVKTSDTQPYSERSKFRVNESCLFQYELYKSCLEQESILFHLSLSLLFSEHFQSGNTNDNNNNNNNELTQNGKETEKERKQLARQVKIAKHKFRKTQKQSGDMCLLHPQDRDILLQLLLAFFNPNDIWNGIPQMSYITPKQPIPLQMSSEFLDTLGYLPPNHYYSLPAEIHYTWIMFLRSPPFCFRFRKFDLACWLVQYLERQTKVYKTVSTMKSNEKHLKEMKSIEKQIISFATAVCILLESCYLKGLLTLVEYDPAWFLSLHTLPRWKEKEEKEKRQPNHSNESSQQKEAETNYMWVKGKMETLYIERVIWHHAEGFLDAAYISKCMKLLEWTHEISPMVLRSMEHFDIHYQIMSLEKKKQDIENQLKFLKAKRSMF